jgi:hypothetical protein
VLRSIPGRLEAESPALLEGLVSNQQQKLAPAGVLETKHYPSGGLRVAGPYLAPPLREPEIKKVGIFRGRSNLRFAKRPLNPRTETVHPTLMNTSLLSGVLGAIVSISRDPAVNWFERKGFGNLH